MTTTLERIEEAELRAGGDLEQLILDEAQGVERDPEEARRILFSAGCSIEEFKILAGRKRQRVADAELVASADGLLKNAIEQEQLRDRLIAERDAKLQKIHRDYAKQLADIEHDTANAQVLEAQRRQAVRRLVGTAPAPLQREEEALAARIRRHRVTMENAREDSNLRRHDIHLLSARLDQTPRGGPQAKNTQAELDAARERLRKSESNVSRLDAERENLNSEMDEIQRRKLNP